MAGEEWRQKLLVQFKATPCIQNGIDYVLTLILNLLIIRGWFIFIYLICKSKLTNAF